MLNLGLAEMAVVAVVALLVVRPAELPGLARTAGRLIGRLRALRHLFARQFEAMAQGPEVSVVERAHRAALARAGPRVRRAPEEGPEGGADTIRTPRLTLRSPTLDDAPAIQALFGRWEVIRWMGPDVPWPYPPNGAEMFLRDTLLLGMDRGKNWALAVCLEGVVIGMVTFRKDAGGDRWETGFWLGEPYWGQGYMTEALAVACMHFRMVHPGAEVYAACDPANRASARVQEKAGFVYQETLTRSRPARNGSTEVEVRVLPQGGDAQNG